MFIVGLTGGIGSGKSTVADYFRQLGVTVVDSDRVARQVVAQGTPELKAIAKHFGSAVLKPDGTLDRSQLRALILDDPNQRIWLENLLHPLIGEANREALAKAEGPYAILESPLLLEKGLEGSVNRVLVVDTPLQLQISRASSRDETTPEQIQSIIDLQMARNDRLNRADDILLNDSSMYTLKSKVNALHKKFIFLSERELQR